MSTPGTTVDSPSDVADVVDIVDVAASRVGAGSIDLDLSPDIADAPATGPESAAVSRRGGLLVLLAILLIAANLRVAVTSIGALLDQLNTGLGLTPTLLGLVTALPTLAFAAFGALTPRLSRRLEPGTILLAGMALLIVGQLLRAITSSAVVFILASGAALAGIAVSNILLPVLVKRYFPGRLGMVTGFYTLSMIAGSSVAAASSVPIADLAGSWRAGIGVWAGFAALTLLPIVGLRRRPAAAVVDVAGDGPIRPSRSRLGWTMAVLFGAQSFSGYAIMGWLPHVLQDAGYSESAAGLWLAVLIAAGLPFALIMPMVAARWSDQRAMVLALAGVMLVAYLGLAVAPGSATVLWILLAAIGQSVFPMTLVLIGMRARSHAGTVALSTFTQSVGYLIAAAGPLSIGLLYDATGGWIASFGVLIGVLVVQALAAVRVARPRTLEDEIVQRRLTRAASVAPVTEVVDANTRGDGSCLTPVREKASNPGTVGAMAGLARRVVRRRPHTPRTKWNIGRHESPRPGGRR